LEAQNLELNAQQLKVAEKVARQLHEVEKKKLEDQKRKRTAEEDWYTIVVVFYTLGCELFAEKWKNNG
jgi:hypothetical protein